MRKFIAAVWQWIAGPAITPMNRHERRSLRHKVGRPTSLVVTVLLMLTGCMKTWQNVNPSWNLPGGERRTVAFCDMQKNMAGGGDWVGNVIAKGNAYDACMYAHGFELRGERR